ncbi:MAG: GNAT family N-acetyltransferase [Chloroflexi bacterium]|nr:GNAT family N-acetyltransferase [Chloroflexota bacterium]
MITPPIATDGAQIHAITANAGVFSAEEVECVDELWEEYQTRGPDRSGYYWLVDRDEGGRVLGYSCYGPRSLTSGTYDLYWIAVDSTIHRGGVGRRLLAATEEAVRKLGGRLLFVETSGLPKYEPTRQFYLGTGYTWEATIKDFYAEGDDLVIFTKHL